MRHVHIVRCTESSQAHDTFPILLPGVCFFVFSLLLLLHYSERAAAHLFTVLW